MASPKKKAPKRKASKKSSAKKVTKKAARKVAKKASKKTAKKGASKIRANKVSKKVHQRTAKQKAFVKKKPSTPAPATEIGPEVLELIAALDDYKLKYNRPFPGWSEVLYVLRGLGYKKS